MARPKPIILMTGGSPEFQAEIRQLFAYRVDMVLHQIQRDTVYLHAKHYDSRVLIDGGNPHKVFRLTDNHNVLVGNELDWKLRLIDTCKLFNKRKKGPKPSVPAKSVGHWTEQSA